MIVSITDYGKTDDSNFVEYSVSDLTSNQMEFLNDNLDEETEIDGNLFKLKCILKTDYILFKVMLPNSGWMTS